MFLKRIVPKDTANKKKKPRTNKCKNASNSNKYNSSSFALSLFLPASRSEAKFSGTKVIVNHSAVQLRTTFYF